MRILPAAPVRSLPAFAAALLSAWPWAGFAGPDDGSIRCCSCSPKRACSRSRRPRRATATSRAARGEPAAPGARPRRRPDGLRHGLDRRPYRRGGTSAETGFDCSGFTRHVFETSLGLVLPRRADEQATAPARRRHARRSAARRPGLLQHHEAHLLARRHLHRRQPLHPCAEPGKDVRTDDLSFAYWAKRFTGARRVETLAAVEPGARRAGAHRSRPAALISTAARGVLAPEAAQAPRGTIGA